MKFSHSSSISDDQITQISSSVKDYTAHLQDVVKTGGYDQNEGSLNLPSDTKTINDCGALAQKLISPKLKYIIDIGIGGSNLGTKAVYDTFFGFFDTVEPGRNPKMIFCDTNDPEFLQKLSVLLKKISSPDEVIVNVISKSGSTTETIANTETLLESLSTLASHLLERVVVTTDEGSNMHKVAESLGVAVLHLPKLVGGRYSIFSSVGLFPLACAGINVKKLCEGAQSMRDSCLSSDTSIALSSAAVLYIHIQKKVNINDNFFFHPELESLGKWYRQLMGESIGKDGKGMTPTVSIGSTDLHSVGQLYYGGPKDKVTTIISSAKNMGDLQLPRSFRFKGLVDHIQGKNVSEIMKAITDAVKISYANEELPFMEIVLDDLSERSLGEFMQFKMIEIMYLAKLLGVNAFDQPHVELYKIEMKKLLTGK